MVSELYIREKERQLQREKKQQEREKLIQMFLLGEKNKSRKGQAGGDSEGNLPGPKAEHLK